MKDKILYIQFRDDRSKEHDTTCILEAVGEFSALVDVFNTIDEDAVMDIPAFISNYACVILGGSGQFYLTRADQKLEKLMERHTPLFRYLLDKDIPTLGICFGHQILAKLLGGEIVADKDLAESGIVIVKKLLQQDALFDSLPETFPSQMGHKDSVKQLPKDCTLTITSDSCPIEGFKYKQNIYTVQFHPELNLKQILVRFKLYPEYTNGKTEEGLMKGLTETPDAARVLTNFLAKYAKK